MKQWYVVSITDPSNRTRHAAYRIRYLDSAKSFVDAMETILAHYRMNPERGLVNPWTDRVANDSLSGNANARIKEVNDPKDVYGELIQLDELRERGILTQAEFDAQKKKLLEGE